MKRSVSAFIVIALLSFSLQTTVAQQLNSFKKLAPAQKAQIITDTLKRSLHLSQVQYNKVYTTTLEGIKKAAWVVQSDDSKFSKGIQLRSILNDTEDGLRLILNREQFALYENYKEKALAYYMRKAD